MLNPQVEVKWGGLSLLILLAFTSACGQVVTQTGDGGGADGAPTDHATTEVATSDVAQADGADAAVSNVDSADAAASHLDSSPHADVGTDADGATSPCRQTPVELGAAANFAVLAGPTITNTGLTSVIGDVGVSPGTAITGLPPGSVIGLQHAGDPTAAQAEADLKTAYDGVTARKLCSIVIAGNLGGKTLLPGLYTSTTSLEISTGDLTLDGHGDPDAIFVFQMTTTMTTTAGRQVNLVGGAKAANIFWQVGSSATLGVMSVFQGTILAAQSVTLTTGATLNGRALARIAAVTLDTNTITKPTP
jgi:Ice-binding-like